MESSSLLAHTPDAYRSRRVCDAKWGGLVRFCSRKRRARPSAGCGGEVREPLSFQLSAIGSTRPDMGPGSHFSDYRSACRTSRNAPGFPEIHTAETPPVRRLRAPRELGKARLAC